MVEPPSATRVKAEGREAAVTALTKAAAAAKENFIVVNVELMVSTFNRMAGLFIFQMLD